MSHTPTLPSSEDRGTASQAATAVPPSGPIDRRTTRLIGAFGNAFAGIWHLLRTQRNAQIHCLVGACAVALGAFLQLARWEWLVLVLTIGLVLAAEGINTAIEAVVDVASPSYHPLARVAKDVGAGSVLLCAITSVVVGCIVFLPHLWPLILALLGG